MRIFVERKSTVKELALYSNAEMETGETIFELKGTEFPVSTQQSIRVGDGKHIVDVYGSYINHSCDPNASIKGYVVTALRTILPGEEITFDYRTTESSLSCPFVCNCCGEAITYGNKQN